MKEGKAEQIRSTVYQYMIRQDMVRPGDHILAAVSGGADSVCLLQLLYQLQQKLGITLSVMHINHMLRDTAERDEEFVKKLCAERDLPFYSRSVAVEEAAKRDGTGIEETARNLRYEALLETAERIGAKKLAVAHHIGDQAETVLFSLCRGSGLAGLGGMHPVTEHVIRPLLCLDRCQIETYLSEQKLSFMEDETNADETYKRNLIRKTILPALTEKVNDQTPQHIAAAAEFARSADDYLQQQTLEAFGKCLAAQTESSISLSIDTIRNMHPYLRMRVLQKAVYEISGQKKDIAAVHIRDVQSLLEKQSGRRIALPYGIKVRRSYDLLIFEKNDQLEGSLGGSSKRSSDGIQDGSGDGTPGGPGHDAGRNEVLVLTKEQLIADEFQKGKEISVSGSRLQLHLMSVDGGKALASIPEKSYTKWLDYDKIDGPVEFRQAAREDYFYFDDTRKKLAYAYFKDQKIPAVQRNRQLVCAVSDHVLAFLPGRISNKVKISGDTKRILEIRLINEKE
ncbi:MAG: tRNA lysidine(34) synthetase TilS [Lachnospiraceae bacterium]|nr:tRNA lysidine(34) synthetase TilS [Lachnospiraceae bacterium]